MAQAIKRVHSRLLRRFRWFLRPAQGCNKFIFHVKRLRHKGYKGSYSTGVLGLSKLSIPLTHRFFFKQLKKSLKILLTNLTWLCKYCMYMYYTLLLKMDIISFFLKRSMHLKRTYIPRRQTEVIIVLWLQGKLQYLIPVHFLEAFQVHCRHFAIVPHNCLFPKKRTVH